MSWRSPVIRVSTLLMEAIWTYALVAFYVAAVTDGGKPSFFGVAAVVLLSYGISRFLQNADISLGVLRVWGTVLSLLVFYAIVRIDFFGDARLWDFGWANDLFNHTEASARANVPAVFGIPLLWCFWIRGVFRGQETNTFEDVVSSFGIGVLVIAFVEVFQGQLDDTPALVGRIAIPYVAFGLFAIALAHSARADTDRGRPFQRTLLATIGLSVLALALVAGLVALFDLATGWGAAKDASRALVDAGEEAGNIVAWPILKIMDGFFAAIIWLRDLIFGTPKPPLVGGQDQGQGPDCVQFLVEDRGLTMQQALDQCNPKPHQWPEWVGLLVRLMVLIPLAGLGLLMTALLFTRFRRRLRPGEQKESAYQQGRLASDLSDLWNNLLGRLRPNLHLGRDQMDPVRRLYWDVLDDAERRGVSRQPQQTPDEIAPSLDRTFHGQAPGRITTAFDDARYGGRLAPESEVRRMREEWEDLRGGN